MSGSDGSIGSEGSEMPGSLSVDFLDVVGDCDAASLLARPLAREDKRGQRVVHLRQRLPRWRMISWMSWVIAML